MRKYRYILYSVESYTLKNIALAKTASFKNRIWFTLLSRNSVELPIHFKQAFTKIFCWIKGGKTQVCIFQSVAGGAQCLQWQEPEKDIFLFYYYFLPPLQLHHILLPPLFLILAWFLETSQEPVMLFPIHQKPKWMPCNVRIP